MSDTLTQRALQIADAAAVADLLMAMERAEPVDEAFGEQDLVEELSGPGADLDRGSLGIFDDGRLVAAGWLLVRTTSEWEAWLHGGVHPDYTGRGLGRRILTELGDRAGQIRDAEAAGLPAELKIGVDEVRHRAVSLIAASGFQTWRYFLRMRCDLREPVPDVARPAGVEVRTFRPADDDAVRLVSNEAFADHWNSRPMDPERWQAQFAGSATFRPEHSRVAVLDGVIVGFVLTAEFDADTEQRGFRTGYISRVGTLRRARGRSVASSLLASVLVGLAAAGLQCAELDVDAESPTGAGALYERVGFGTVGRLQVLGRRF